MEKIFDWDFFIKLASYLWIVILISTVWAWIYVSKSVQRLMEKRRWIEMLPSLISTLGVLGTFGGITIGLLNFDTKNLPESIPLLLEGLKTAFFTSLAGMIGSIILSRRISSLYNSYRMRTYVSYSELTCKWYRYE